MDSASLRNSIFEKEASLRKQFYKCSAGKLNIYPTDKGVLDVRVNMNIKGANVADVVGAVDIEGLKQLTGVTSFRDYADLTMFVVPQGTTWREDFGWSAYAVIDGKGSVVNDSYVNYLGVQMHELGHNFGLNHANRVNDTFRDLTSQMSRALLDQDFPIKCFNAQNHWQLGWYSDRSINVNPDAPQKVKILGFVDYAKAIQGKNFVVVKVGENLYLQFNRAKLHNIDTEEAQDKLVIVVDNGGPLGTTLVAELDNDNRLYTNTNFESSGRQLNVEVCRTVMGGTDNDIDWMEVSIGYGPSICGAQLADYTGLVLPPVNSATRPRPRPGAPQASQQNGAAAAFFAQFGGRGNDRDEPARSPASAPSRFVIRRNDRLKNVLEEVPVERPGTVPVESSATASIESSGTATFNNPVLYTMVAVASVAALL
jgi:hypothetical protein